MDGDGHADARVGARELLEHEDVREEVGARAAVLLRHADAHQPELAQLAEQRRAETRARGPTRRRSARSPPPRNRAPAPGSPAAPASARSPRRADYRDEVRRQSSSIALALTAAAATRALPPSRSRAPGAPPSNRDDNEAAARLFAPRREDRPERTELPRDPRGRRALERGLPCGGRITRLERHGKDEVIAQFELTERPRHTLRRAGRRRSRGLPGEGREDRRLAPDRARPRRRQSDDLVADADGDTGGRGRPDRPRDGVLRRRACRSAKGFPPRNVHD